MPQPRQIRVLVAEDPFVNTFLRAILERNGHLVTTAEPAQASGMLQSGHIQADVVITNQPRAFFSLRDWLPILYTAANPDPEIAAHFRNCRALRKPFLNQALIDAIGELSQVVLT